MKKQFISLVILGACTINIANAAATITFKTLNQPTTINSPVTVKGAGIDGLTNPTPANGTFTIQNDAQGRVFNTNVSIENINNAHIPQMASGSIGWSSEGSSSYTFTLSAGGHPGKWDPKQDYCVSLIVDGTTYSNNCTSSTAYWSPTLVNGVVLGQNSKIEADITYK